MASRALSDLDAADVAAQLGRAPLILKDAMAPSAAGGLPIAPGLYAWWSRPNALVVPVVPNAAAVDWHLLYVGISPSRATSSQNLRRRVAGNHVGGNTGSSTFRFVLASLLREPLELTPHRNGAKVELNARDNQRLRAWQYEYLGLTWCARRQPWLVEREVITRMAPPLNAAGNAAHPFYASVVAARTSYRGAAR